MANLTAVIGADTSKFVEEVSSAKYMLNKFIKETEKASSTAKDNASASKEQINAYSRVISELEKVSSGSMTTTQQLKALTEQIKELKVQWQGLSNETKAGGFGQSLADTMRSASDELNNLKGKLSSIGEGDPAVKLKRQLRQTTEELLNLTVKYRQLTAAERATPFGVELSKKISEVRAKAGNLKDVISDTDAEIKIMASDTPRLDTFNQGLSMGADLLSTYTSLMARLNGDSESLRKALATIATVQSAVNLSTKVAAALQSSSILMLKVRTMQEGAAATAIKIRAAAEGKSTIVTKAATVAQAAFNVVAKANPYVILSMALIACGAALIGFCSNTGKATEKEKELQAEAERTQKKLEEQKHAAETLGSKTGDLTSKFMVLQKQWQGLKTEAEKKEWINKNQQAFEQLNLSVWNVNDAYEIFVKNAPKVIAALKAIAEAEAFKDLYKEAIVKKEKEWTNRSKSRATGDYYNTFHPSDKLSDEEARAAGVRTSAERWSATGMYQSQYGGGKAFSDYSDAETKKVNDRRAAEAKATREGLEQGYDAAIQYYGDKFAQANATAMQSTAFLSNLGGTGHKPAGSGGHGGSRSHGGKSNGPTFKQGSLADLENQLSDLQKKYKDGLLPNLTSEEYLKQVNILQEQIHAKKIELGLVPTIPEGSLTYIENQINDKQAELKLAVDDESRKRIQDEIDALTGQKEAIMLKLKPVVDEQDIEELTNSISEHINKKSTVVIPIGGSSGDRKVDKAQSNADNLKEELDFHKSIIASYKDEYKLIQQRIAAGATLTDNENRLVSIYDEAIGKVNDLTRAYDKAAESARDLQLSSQLKKKTWEGVKRGIGTIGDLNGAVSNVGSTWTSLAKQWEDMNSFEKVTASIDACISTIETCIGAYESINDMIKLFGEISEISAAKKLASNAAEMASDQSKMALETANTQTKIANDTAENTSEIGKLGVKEAGALAGATEAGAGLMFPANIAAIAAGIAAVVAAFAMVFSCFAEGGIVGGGNKIGDHNVVRVNSGEMILNGTQQKRLFNLLNGSGSRNGSVVGDGGNVKFRIKGNSLYGVLKNHNQKYNKIGK